MDLSQGLDSLSLFDCAALRSADQPVLRITVIRHYRIKFLKMSRGKCLRIVIIIAYNHLMDQYYADDSVNNNCIGYLAVGVNSIHANTFLNIYKKIKVHFNIPLTYSVHAKFLFNERERIKNEAIKHLSHNDCFNFFLKTYYHYKQYCLQPILSTADKRHFPPIQKKMTFEDLVLDEKQVINLLKSAVMLEVYNRHDRSENNYEFYADKVDLNDKISMHATPLTGVKRRYMMPSALLDPDITGQTEHVRLGGKKYEDAHYKEMYEIADMCVYLSTKALTIQEYKYKKLYKEIYEYMELCHLPLAMASPPA